MKILNSKIWSTPVNAKPPILKMGPQNVILGPLNAIIVHLFYFIVIHGGEI